MAKVAFIMDNIFEDSEFQVPYDKVREAGHEAVIVGMEAGKELTRKNGTKATVEQMAHDVVNFLAWAAEPEMEARKRRGLSLARS